MNLLSAICRAQVNKISNYPSFWNRYCTLLCMEKKSSGGIFIM